MFTKETGFARGGEPYIMGVLNVTPDSFSDGGRHQSVSAAVTAAAHMQAAGAHCIDLGGQSTRPGFTPIPPEEEAARVLPVLKAMRGVIHLPVSVDTFYPYVADLALSEGAAIINDVGGEVGGAMAGVIRRHRAGWIITHICRDGELKYPVAEVAAWLKFAVRMAEDSGVPLSHLYADPGIGFGKNTAEDLALLANVDKLAPSPAGLLIGCSRKRCIGGAMGGETSPVDRDSGSHAAGVMAALCGAGILRVHDVPGAVASIKVMKAIKAAGEDKELIF